jgi:SAM-dependent methyltransferase
MLKRAGAEEVVGIDIADAVIAVARDQVRGEIDFEVADLASLPYPARSFDLVICFEAIEHVEEPEVVLDELARVLAPDGVLLVSSPHRARYVPGNPHHRHEYLPEELRSTLRTRFGAVRLLSQHAMIASVLSDERSEPELEDDSSVRRLAAPGDDDGVYTLAMAGERLPDPGPALVTLTGFVELRQWLELYNAQDEILRRQKRMLSEQAAADDERLQALLQLAAAEQSLSRLPSIESRLDAATDDLRRARSELAAALELIARADDVLRDMQGSVSWRITTPLRAVKRLRRSAK